MVLTHKIALDPTCKQLRYFVQAAGCDRFVWNLALEQWNADYAAGKKPSGSKLRKKFNTTKYQQYPWMKDIHRDAHANAFIRLQRSFVLFLKNPKHFKHPVFHKKGRRDSFYVRNDRLTVGTAENGKEFYVRLPVIGWIRMYEKLRFNGKIMCARVHRRAQRWFISIQVEMGDVSKERTGSGVCGVDLGIKNAATIVSDSGAVEKVEAPKPLAAALVKLRRMQRSVSRRKKGGNNRRKLVNRVARVHARVANIRADFWNKLITRLCRENQAVGIETLNTQGMLRNRRLSRALSDVGLGMFKPRMEYKAKIYGVQLSAVSPWFPSSKTCSRCGVVKESLSLSERVFHCDQCLTVKDRDENAAANLCAVAKSKIPAACGEFTLGEKQGCKRLR